MFVSFWTNKNDAHPGESFPVILPNLEISLKKSIHPSLVEIDRHRHPSWMASAQPPSSFSHLLVVYLVG